jgi:hypothetical protein
MRFASTNWTIHLVILFLLLLIGSAVAAGQANSGPASAPKVQTAASPENAITITVSPLQLEFGPQLVGSTSPSRTATVTVNAASEELVKVAGTPSGDFELTSKNCDLKGSGPCAISVAFAPKQLGETTTFMTIVASANATTLTRVVALTGKGVARCGEGSFVFSRSWFLSLCPVLLVVLLFMAGIILVRWNLIARPTRSLLQAQIEAVKSRVATLIAAGGGTPPTGAAQVSALLDRAEDFIRDKSFLVMLPDYFLWNRGQEISGWSCVHEAEEQMVPLLPMESVRAELERAEADLRQAATPVAVGLADRIHDVLTTAPILPIDRGRAVLSDALGLLYDRTDNNFASLISWQNKTVWLVGCGLLFIVSLAGALQHEVLFLVGATGGLLSRLSRSLNREDVPTDYGASWTTLFLSPVVGALAGWSGVLLFILASDFNIVGSALKIDWCNPYSPIALGVALLLGTSERAFDSVLDQLEQKVKAQPAPPQPPPSTTLNITTPASLPGGNIDQAYDQPLAASGGTSPYKWALTAGTLPSGLNLNPSGRITGAPTVGVTAKFTLQVIDANSKTKSQEFTLVVS